MAQSSQTDADRARAGVDAVAWMSPESVPDLVSVIVPVHDRAALVTPTVESVLAQSYRPIELIVVDDGSADGTSQVVSAWCGGHDACPGFRARCIRQEHSGAPAARNLGLVQSRGEFIQFLDSDDLLHSDKLSVQVGLLRADVSLDFVYSPLGRFTAAARWDCPGVVGYELPDRERIAGYVRKAPWTTASGVYRRRACVATGPWDTAFPRMQEWEYNLRFLLTRPRLRYVDTVLSLQRVHGAGRISDIGALPCATLVRQLQFAYATTLRRVAAAGLLDRSATAAYRVRVADLVLLAVCHGECAVARQLIGWWRQCGLVGGLGVRMATYRWLVRLPGSVAAPLAGGLQRLAFPVLRAARRRAPW